MMRFSRILLVLLVLLALVIAACDPEEEDDSDPEQETTPVTDVVDDEENETNGTICVANRFDIEGQGEQMWFIGGATGGDEIVVTDQDGNETTAEQLIEMGDPRLNPVLDLETQDVAVIVLDDFYDFAGEDISHGTIVSLQIQQQIRSREPYDFDPDRTTVNGYPVLRWNPEDEGLPTLYIIEADTDFVISQVVAALQDALHVAGDELGANRVAVNMSFAAVPCEITENFDLREYQRRIDGASEGEPIARRTVLAALVGDDEYMAPDTLEAVLGSPEERFSEVYGQLLALYGQVNELEDEGVDQLHQLIQETLGIEANYWNPEERTVIYVGAAGNMGRNQECLVPASWPEVICTSASIIDSTPNEIAWEGSNMGQTMTLGGFHWIVTNPPHSTDLAYIGTSFAAPVVTSNLAFYLTVEQLCQNPPLDISLTAFNDRPFREALESAGCVTLN
jgi:hypothetical protein